MRGELRRHRRRCPRLLATPNIPWGQIDQSRTYARGLRVKCATWHIGTVTSSVALSTRAIARTRRRSRARASSRRLRPRTRGGDCVRSFARFQNASHARDARDDGDDGVFAVFDGGVRVVGGGARRARVRRGTTRSTRAAVRGVGVGVGVGEWGDARGVYAGCGEDKGARGASRGVARASGARVRIGAAECEEGHASARGAAGEA